MREVLENNIGFVVMSCHPTPIVLQPLYVIFPPARVDPEVEIFCVGVAFLEVSDSGCLPFSCALQDGETHDPLLQGGA